MRVMGVIDENWFTRVPGVHRVNFQELHIKISHFKLYLVTSFNVHN